MTFSDFLESDTPGSEWPVSLCALWYDAREDWHKAHELVQDASAGDEAWVHAYLHRKEGDIWNADYWYRRAGKSRPDFSLEEEWSRIVHALLS